MDFSQNFHMLLKLTFGQRQLYDDLIHGHYVLYLRIVNYICQWLLNNYCDFWNDIYSIGNSVLLCIYF